MRWRRDLGAAVLQGPIVAPDGTIYAASGDGVLHALDPVTGRDRWTFDAGPGLGGDLTTSAGLLADGTIVWPGPKLTVFGISPQGRELWRLQRRGTPHSPAIVDASSFYVGDSAGGLAAYRVEGATPVLRWELDLGEQSYGSPSVAPDGSVRTTVDSDVVAVRDNGSSGEVVWRATAGDIIEVSAAAGGDGTTVVGSNDRHLYGIDESGQQVWSVGLKVFPYSSPSATPAGRVWIGTNDGELFGVDIDSGKVAVRVRLSDLAGTRSGVWSSPVLDAQGRVYVGTLDGTVYGLTAEGELMFAIQTGGAVNSTGALTDDGGYLVGNQAGELTLVHD